MKTIMSEQEFHDMVAHLAEVFAGHGPSLSENWKCQRSFAGEQKADEPPISVKGRKQEKNRQR
jgi:hypothetical protein